MKDLSKNTKLNIFLLLLNALIFAVSSGINAVSFPYLLHQNSVPDFLIGISVATDIGGGILIARFLHSLSRKVSLFDLMIFFALLETSIILLAPFYQNFALWAVFMLINGMSWFSILSLRQAWLNIVINDKIRAPVLAMGSTMICGGFTLGPIIIKMVGSGSYFNFMISALAILTSSLILTPLKKHQPTFEDGLEEGIFSIIRKNHRIFLARFLLDFECAVVISFTVIYGIKNGLSAEDAGLLVSAFMGIGLLDFLIGFVLHKRPYRKFINIGFLGCLISILILPLVINNFYWSFVIFLIYGWFVSLAFVACIASANTNKQKEELVALNSIFQAISSSGAFCGALLVGLVMHFVGKNGFILMIALPSIIYFIIQYLVFEKIHAKN